MSHILQNRNTTFAAVLFTIVNYSTGGESVLPQEFGVPSLSGVIFGNVLPSGNSLGIELFPVAIGGKVQLREFSGGSFTEIPPTVGLNAVVVAIIFT